MESQLVDSFSQLFIPVVCLASLHLAIVAVDLLLLGPTVPLRWSVLSHLHSTADLDRSHFLTPSHLGIILV